LSYNTNFKTNENNGMSGLRHEYRCQKRILPDLRLRISPTKPLDSAGRHFAGTAVSVPDYILKEGREYNPTFK